GGGGAGAEGGVSGGGWGPAGGRIGKPPAGGRGQGRPRGPVRDCDALRRRPWRATESRRCGRMARTGGQARVRTGPVPPRRLLRKRLRGGEEPRDGAATLSGSRRSR